LGNIFRTLFKLKKNGALALHIDRSIPYVFFFIF